MDSETIFAVLVGIALACFGLAMVGYSFFRHREPEDSAIPLRSDSDSAGVGLEALLDSVDTLELEHQLGNIPEEQYLQQLQSYRLQIAALVRDQLESGAASPEMALEQEVLLARSRMNGSWRSCPRCDAPLPGALEASGSLPPCPHCGAPLEDVLPQTTSGDAPAPPAEGAEVP